MSAAARRRLVGVMANRRHQGDDPVVTADGYTLAIVEFDDQGRCYRRAQMAALQGVLDTLGGRDAVIVVFVHGWRHDGRTDDDNLVHFRAVLKRVAAEERAAGGAPVVGVFVAWRGLSLYGFGVLELATFGDRKLAGMRVAMGAPRELFGRLRQYRRGRRQAGGTPLLIVIGHSFGGMIVYTALAQSLIEAAATQSGRLVPSYADLVLLVNPAFEAVRYLPVHDLIDERDDGSFADNQEPVFVSVTARNDWATGIAFPLGMALSPLYEGTRGREERQALTRTMGHLPWMLTHRLSLAASPDARQIGGAWLERVRFSEKNPFWVASATPDVVDGHNGIWMPPFIAFVEALVLAHARRARLDRAQQSTPALRADPLPPAPQQRGGGSRDW